MSSAARRVVLEDERATLRLRDGGAIRWAPSGEPASEVAAPAVESLTNAATREKALARLAGIWLLAATGRTVTVAAPSQGRARLESAMLALDGREPLEALARSGLGRRDRDAWRPVLLDAAACDLRAPRHAATLAGPDLGGAPSSRAGREIALTMIAWLLLIALLVPMAGFVAEFGSDDGPDLRRGIGAVAAWVDGTRGQYDAIAVLGIIAAFSVGFGIAGVIEQAAPDAGGGSASGFAGMHLGVQLLAGLAAMAHLALSLVGLPLGRGLSFADVAIGALALVVAALAAGFIWLFGLTSGERARRARSAEERAAGLARQLRALGGVDRSPSLARFVKWAFVLAGLSVAAGGVLGAMVRKGVLPGVEPHEAGSTATSVILIGMTCVAYGVMALAAPAPHRPAPTCWDWGGSAVFGLLATLAPWLAVVQLAIVAVDSALPTSTWDEPTQLACAALIAVGALVLAAIPVVAVQGWLVRQVRGGATLTPGSARKTVARELRFALRQIAEGEATQREAQRDGRPQDGRAA